MKKGVAKVDKVQIMVMDEVERNGLSSEVELGAGTLMPPCGFSAGRQAFVSGLRGAHRGHHQLPGQEQTDPALLCHLPHQCAEVHGEQRNENGIKRSARKALVCVLTLPLCCRPSTSRNPTRST